MENVANTVSFEEVKKRINQQRAWGVLTSIDLKNCDGEMIRSREKIKQYVIELCDLIQMNRFGECQIVHFGEDEKVAGFSMTQLIETSLISGHFANLTNNAYMDVFSCKEYDVEIVADFSKKFFKASEVATNVLFRD